MIFKMNSNISILEFFFLLTAYFKIKYYESTNIYANKFTAIPILLVIYVVQTRML